jgi:hypothetical protein
MFFFSFSKLNDIYGFSSPVTFRVWREIITSTRESTPCFSSKDVFVAQLMRKARLVTEAHSKPRRKHH